MKSTLRILIFIALVLATLDKGSPQITSIELLLAGVLFFVFLLSIIQFLNTNQSIPKPLIYLFGFLLLAAIDVVISLSNGVSFLWWTRRYFPILILPMTILSSIIAFRSKKQIQTSYIILVIISLSVVIYSLFQLRTVNLSTIISLQSLRKYGGGYNASLGVCLAIPFLFRRKQLKHLTWLLSMLVFIIFFTGLVLTFTRTYWISTTVALLLMLFLLIKIHWVKISFVYLVYFIMLTALVLSALIWIMPPTIKNFLTERAVSIFHANTNLSLLDRISELRGIWSNAIKNPISIIVGNGLGSKFTFYSMNPWSWGAVGWMKNDYSHNYYAYLFWSTGLVGLYLFVIFWLSLLRKLSRALYYASTQHSEDTYYFIGIYTTIVNLLITLLTAPPLMTFKWAIYFGILVGLALNLIRRNVSFREQWV